MQKLCLLLIGVLLIISCTKEKTDEDLLNEDRKKLTESLDSYLIQTYKFGKICIRGAAHENEGGEEFSAVKSTLDNVSKRIIKYGTDENEKLTLLDYVSIYRSYKEMTDYVSVTDEDDFPTLSEAFNLAYSDSITQQHHFLEGQEKIIAQNTEHAVLGVIALATRGMGREIALYECSKTNPELLPDGELKALFRLLRAFLFFDSELNYLSEYELTQNINWQNKNSQEQFPIVKDVLNLDSINQGKVFDGFYALNHLFRGVNRLMMKREIDQERALEDLGVFLQQSNELGISNELTYAIDAYLNLQKGDAEKAILALKNLGNSDLISSKEKKVIEESISFLENREPDKVLNGLYDKYFLGKIVAKYVYSLMGDVKWEQYFIEKDVPHVESVFKIKDRVEDLLLNVRNSTSKGSIKDKVKSIRD